LEEDPVVDLGLEQEFGVRDWGGALLVALEIGEEDDLGIRTGVDIFKRV
jgi:hypothetical protein